MIQDVPFPTRMVVTTQHAILLKRWELTNISIYRIIYIKNIHPCKPSSGSRHTRDQRKRFKAGNGGITGMKKFKRLIATRSIGAKNVTVAMVVVVGDPTIYREKKIVRGGREGAWCDTLEMWIPEGKRYEWSDNKPATLRSNGFSTRKGAQMEFL